MARRGPANTPIEDGLVGAIEVPSAVSKGRVPAEALKHEDAEGPIVHTFVVAHSQNNLGRKILRMTEEAYLDGKKVGAV